MLSPYCSEVAVVVPCYNAANYLARALDSVLAQTRPTFCLCVVDDGSNDETPEIVRRYSRYGVHLRQKRAGPAAARNRGIGMCETPYVAFLDADDYWLPEKLDRQIEILESNPNVGLVCSDCATLKNGQLAGASLGAGTLPGSGKLFELLMRECFIFTPTVVVRRKCLQEVGLFYESLKVSEDFDLWLRIAARWEIAVVPEVLAVRESVPSGLSLSTETKVCLEHGIAALKHVESVCNDLPRRERRTLRRAIAERYYIHGSYLLAKGSRAESRTQFSEVLARSPADWRSWIKYGLSFLPGWAARFLMDSRRWMTRTGN